MGITSDDLSSSRKNFSENGGWTSVGVEANAMEQDEGWIFLISQLHRLHLIPCYLYVTDPKRKPKENSNF